MVPTTLRSRPCSGCHAYTTRRDPALWVLVPSVVEQITRTPEALAREKRFLELARKAHTELFEEQGAIAPVETILLRAIEADKALWQTLQPQLAEHGALALIKALVRKTVYVIDDDSQLDLFPNMPRVIPFKKQKVNLLKATTSELEWYGEWWNHRLEGLAKRTEEDLAISGEIERLKRALKKYDPTGTVETALRIRNERLEAAKRARQKRESNSSGVKKHRAT